MFNLNMVSLVSVQYAYVVLVFNDTKQSQSCNLLRCTNQPPDFLHVKTKKLLHRDGSLTCGDRHEVNDDHADCCNESRPRG